jgi:ATP-dependent RNA helicase DeaD
MFAHSVHPTLAKALDERGYSTPTPVQTAVLGEGAPGRDLLVSARTGSGKTVAYGVAFAADLLGEVERLPRPDAPLALVIAPTRELALQVRTELDWLYAPAGGRVLSCVGGMDPRREQRDLAAGAHIVVGTPGRLRDHIERGQLRTGDLRVVVLDEADEMLDLGFREELEEILDTAPPERRTLLFSATLPHAITALARRYQKDALRLEVGGGERAHGDIAYQAVRIAPSDIENATVNLLRFHEAGAALVFCSTREAVRRLHANLVERGFAVVALSGELSQAERTHALQALRDRRARVCVATDVAARGIDVAGLELVIHADLPVDAETLQHRSGRTGRAGAKGVCAILVPHPKRRRAEQLLRAARVEAEWTSAPTAEAIRLRDTERLLATVGGAEALGEEDLALAKLVLAERGAEAVAAALVQLNRARLPSPEDMVDVGPATPPDALREAPRPGFEDTVWFRIDIGRNKNADPKWLLPLICRRGHVTKRDIGAIRVFDRETRFEIQAAVAERFTEALRGGVDSGEVIERLDEAGPLPPRERRPVPRGKPPRPPRDAAAADQKPWTPPTEAVRPKPLKTKAVVRGPSRPKNKSNDHRPRN